jgi:hypothetical protein
VQLRYVLMRPARISNWLRCTLLLGCLWLLGLQQALAQDDPPGRVGRLAALQGEAWVFDPEQGEWVAALLNRPITAGDRIATEQGASLELQIGSTTLLLGSQTEFEALRLDDERLHFKLQRGQMALFVRSAEVAAELEVLHPEARFRPLRPGLYRIDRLAEASDATVQRGELQVEGHNLSMTLQAGQRAAFWREGALGDTTRQWLTQQQDEFTQAMLRHEQTVARSAVAPQLPAEMTGIEDLDRHGQWQQHPEFGAVWSPSVVAVGWAPFRHGRWVWLRPWGWTWVDAAPWGFAPSHYGRWLWWGNRWCWAPGPWVRRPAFAPALVGWVGPPPGVVVVGRPPLPGAGWVPLGPREPYRPIYRSSPGHWQRLNPHLPPGWLPPPGHQHRNVPGAVTQWSGPFFGPPRGQRETVAPRAAMPVAGVPAAPASPVTQPPRPRPQAPATPITTPPAAAAALPAATPVVPPSAPPTQPGPPRAAPPGSQRAGATGPYHGRPAQTAQTAQAAPTPPTSQAAPAAQAPAMRAAPPAARPTPVAAAAPPPQPAPAAAPPAPRTPPVQARPVQDPGERRRPPEARGNQRER